MAGRNTYPGRTAIVRVDNANPLPATDFKGLLPQLLKGETAYVTYYVWPRGQEQMTVKLAGLSEAYQVLKQKAKSNRAPVQAR